MWRGEQGIHLEERCLGHSRFDGVQWARDRQVYRKAPVIMIGLFKVGRYRKIAQWKLINTAVISGRTQNCCRHHQPLQFSCNLKNFSWKLLNMVVENRDILVPTSSISALSAKCFLHVWSNWRFCRTLGFVPTIAISFFSMRFPFFYIIIWKPEEHTGIPLCRGFNHPYAFRLARDGLCSPKSCPNLTISVYQR